MIDVRGVLRGSPTGRASQAAYGSSVIRRGEVASSTTTGAGAAAASAHSPTGQRRTASASASVGPRGLRAEGQHRRGDLALEQRALLEQHARRRLRPAGHDHGRHREPRSGGALEREQRGREHVGAGGHREHHRESELEGEVAVRVARGERRHQPAARGHDQQVGVLARGLGGVEQGVALDLPALEPGGEERGRDGVERTLSQLLARPGEQLERPRRRRAAPRSPRKPRPGSRNRPRKEPQRLQVRRPRWRYRS